MGFLTVPTVTKGNQPFMARKEVVVRIILTIGGTYASRRRKKQEKSNSPAESKSSGAGIAPPPACGKRKPMEKREYNAVKSFLSFLF